MDSVAGTSKGKEVRDHDHEDLDVAVDSVCKAIMARTFPTRMQRYDYKFKASDNVFYMEISHLPEGSHSISSFLEFCKNYRSKFDKCMERYSRVGRYPIDDVLLCRPAKTCPTDDGVHERYENFKRFAIVDDYSDHLFAGEPCVERSKYRGNNENSKLWLATIHEDIESFKNSLPETMYVRAYSMRMDLLRVLIVGPKGTPYQDGLFFFDMYFSEMFPLDGPHVRVHCAGYAIHPHMMKCGQFHLCISRKPVNRKQALWEPLETSCLNFLRKINNFILNAEPLFHESGFAGCAPSLVTDYFSLLYNENILLKSLKIMIHIMNNPPKYFDTFVVGHFRKRVLDILGACDDYMKGKQVDGVGDCCYSEEFRNDVAACFPDLLNAFNNIGATEANNFKAPNLAVDCNLIVAEDCEVATSGEEMSKLEMEHQLTQLKVQLSEKTSLAEKSEIKISELTSKINEPQKLIQKLEDDILKGYSSNDRKGNMFEDWDLSESGVKDSSEVFNKDEDPKHQRSPLATNTKDDVNEDEDPKHQDSPLSTKSLSLKALLSYRTRESMEEKENTQKSRHVTWKTWSAITTKIKNLHKSKHPRCGSVI